MMEGSEGAKEDSQPLPLQIYDVPYEVNADGDNSPVTRRELDLRPSTEYELLWEWKKERIARSLSGIEMSYSIKMFPKKSNSLTSQFCHSHLTKLFSPN